MKDINIEINVCDSTGKSTCTVHPHTCCHSDNGSGQEPGVSGVASVFGRTGVVTAQSGDYTADQITETATRKFATSDEKAVWNAKQNELISGTTIRTLFGQSLLGSGDLSLTPAQMGAAAVGHTHTTAEITDYTQKTKQLIHSSLEAGTGVTLSYNPASEKTVISATGGGSGSGSSGYVVADRQGATAGQNHVFSISPQNKFNLAAYALKEVPGTTNQTYGIDDFAMASEVNYALTNAIIFDGMIHSYIGRTPTLNVDGALYSAPIRADGEFIDVSVVQESVVPKMTSNITPIGYVVSASEMSRPLYAPFYALDNDNNLSTDANDHWGGLGAASVSNPQWLRIDLPAQATLGSYNFANRTASPSNSPKDWILQGSNDNGVTWVNLHTVTNDANNTLGAVREYQLPAPVSYKSYRLYITATFNNNAYVTLKKFNLIPPVSKLLIKGGGKWYSVNNGVLTEVGPNDFERGFLTSGKIPYSAIASLLPITVCSDAEVVVQNIYTPYPQMAIQKSLQSAAAWGQINSATLTATQTGNGKVRVAVTRDLVNWHVLRNGVWVDVGALSVDTAGATALIADGMTPTELGSITAAQWTQLFASNNGVPDSLAFAFALDITDPVADVATIDRLALNVNDASSWKVQSPAEVEIRWRTDSVTFRTATAGNYKLAYQVP
ncbi:discoidin domain-containing protein [Pectobacterium punjabense]|uniref:discoidin domain-containing protein n=1 Tax=Pectobacterium punjabense TaxID=2108399 RepID=UPI00380FFC04